MQKTSDKLKALYPDQTFTNPRTFLEDALIHQLATQTVRVEGDAPRVLVPYVEQDPTVGFVAEGEKIPEADTAFAQLEINTYKLATIQVMSNEAIYRGEGKSMALDSMRNALTTKSNYALLQGESKPTGLWNTEGIVDGGQMAAGDLDALSDTITTVESNGATVSHIVMHPSVWGAMRKLKTGKDSAQLLLGSPAEQAEKRLFGIPVIVSNQMPDKGILVVDKTNIMAAYSEITPEISTDARFEWDSIVMRMTFRLGFGAIRANRIGKITLAGK